MYGTTEKVNLHSKLVFVVIQPLILTLIRGI